MKIRQKIAMLLAAAMTLTAMPIMTMAQTDTKVVSGIQLGVKDQPANNSLRIEMKDVATTTVDFFVVLDNAEFAGPFPNPVTTGINIDGTAAISVSATRTAAKEMRVTVAPLGATGKNNFTIPLNVTLKGGDATVEIVGGGSVISSTDPIIFAKTSENKGAVTVEDAKTIYGEPVQVAKIIIDEPFRNVLTSGNLIKYTLRHTDYTIQSAIVNFERAYITTNRTDAHASVNIVDNGTVLEVDPNVGYGVSNGNGRITVLLTLKTTEKKPSTGDLNVKVSGTDVTTTTVKVAEVKDYGVTLKMKDEKVVDVVAGQSKDITFTIEETVANTFVTNRDFDVEFDGAFLYPVANPSATAPSAAASQEKGLIDDIVAAMTNSDTELTITAANISLIKDNDDFVTGFTVNVPAAGFAGSTAPYKIVVKDLKTFVPLTASGDVKVTASGRALGYDASAVAINAKQPVKVTMEPMTIKVGLKEQVGGKIVLEETDKSIFEQGEYILINLEDEIGLNLKDEDFAKNDKIKVTSGDLVLDLEATKVTDGTLAIKVKRSSDTASTITIENLKFYSDRTVPQGNYKFELGGRALTTDWTLEGLNTNTLGYGSIIEADKTDITIGDTLASHAKMVKPVEVKDFVIVATANTEDISSNGLKKGTASFVIGSAKYVVNGVEAEMDGAVYLDNGRTMVPVRYVANALGVAASDIYFANGTATVIAGTKTVSLTLGDKVAKLNGVPAKAMVAAPVLKDGRTYVPVAEIGALLGVEATWDAATQTATFTNK
ncbi:MAG: copper amine oxidase-like protein [Clostridia bacterium]|jgi:hypothetical protein|nr:copper amine oxidase-like protein [Clostridia bacterium]